jgi:hypothetical protein
MRMKVKERLKGGRGKKYISERRKKEKESKRNDEE